jgi:translocation and assembly module TamB
LNNNLRRLLKWAFWGGASAILAVAALLAFALATGPGARITLSLVAGQLPFALEFSDATGRLIGPLVLRDIKLETGGLQVEVDRLQVEWRPLELLSGRVHLERVEVTGVRGLVRRPEADSVTSPKPEDTAGVGADTTGLGLALELVFDEVRLQDGSLEISDEISIRDLQLTASGRLEAYRAHLETVLRVPEVGDTRVEASGTGTERGFEVEQVRADLLGGILQGAGSLSWQPGLAWELAFEAEGIAPSRLTSSPEDWPGELSLRGRAIGSVRDSEVTLQAEVDTLFGSLRGEVVAGTFGIGIDGARYTLDDVDIEWGPASLYAAGIIAEDLLDLEFEVQAPDLAAVLPKSSGSLAAAGRLTGSPSAPVANATAQARNLAIDGTKLMTADARIDVDWGERRKNEILVTAAGLELSGQVIDSLSLDVRGTREAHDLTAALTSAEADITLSATGRLSGQTWAGALTELNVATREFETWRIADPASLSVSKDGVAIDPFCLSAVAGEVCAEGEWTSEAGWRASSSLSELPLALLKPLLPEGWSLEGTVTGEISASATSEGLADVDIDLQPGDGTLRYAIGDSIGDLRYREARIALRADSDSLRSQLYVEFSDSAAIDFGNLGIDIRLPAISALSEEATSEGLREALADDWLVDISMTRAPLALLNAYLPEGTTLSGYLDGQLDAGVAADGMLSGQFELRPLGAAVHRFVKGEVRTVRLVDSSVLGGAGPDGLSAELTLALARPDSAPQATLTGFARLPQYTNLDQAFRDQTVEGRVDGQLDLSVLDALVADLSGSSGQIEVELGVEGTVAEPKASGFYLLRGQTNVASLGIALRDIEIRATDSAEGDFEIEGAVTSGDGRLIIQGRSPPIPTAESPTRLTIKGSDFQALQTDQVSLQVSPDLEVLLTGSRIIVNGDVSVPRAAIELLHVPESAVRVSKDVVFVGDTAVERSPPLEVTANVRLVLGEEVTFRGFGISTYLDGSIEAMEKPGQPTEGRGELVFREGIYRGYGQNLNIDPGRLVFAGPIDDPTVDVRAYRRADDGTRAGFLVRGSLKSLNVEVWSDPVKSQSNALSYILFGRSLAQASESDQAAAGSAAAVLGGNILAMSMASKVGLDDARIETGTRRQDAAFYAGKYLSPKLYVAYGVGLYQPVNVLRVRYIISRKLSVQAETGTRDSGDILYRIER